MALIAGLKLRTFRSINIFQDLSRYDITHRWMWVANESRVGYAYQIRYGTRHAYIQTVITIRFSPRLTNILSDLISFVYLNLT